MLREQPPFAESHVQTSRPPKRTTDAELGLRLFTCTQCGSAMTYRTGDKAISCTACSSSQTIESIGESITEHPLEEALRNIRLKPLTTPETTVHCDICGASFTWDASRLSDKCPYCKTPIAKLDTENNRLHIEAIVPFSVDKKTAFGYFSKWLKQRWFAPNVLKEMSGHSKQFEGVYVPHWTFDSLTFTDYRGQRGQHYVEYVRQTRMVDGKMQTVDVPVTKTRWYPAAGQVRVMFDDVLVLASMLIPKTIVNRLRPWHLKRAEPYTPEYLAGLKANYYQLDLDDAFQIAQQRMASDIDHAIRRNIGGDVQQIHSKRTRYQNSTYKLMLLPVWYSAFEYNGKMYQTVINGQTGKVAGHYPKSAKKIAIAVILGLIALAAAGYFASISQPY